MIFIPIDIELRQNILEAMLLGRHEITKREAHVAYAQKQPKTD